MSNPWFRFYSEFSHDPKVQMMSEAMQRRYVMVMCLRCSNVLVTLHETEIAFHLRVTDAELAETKALFISKGFIDDKWNLLNWEKRQFVSDSSAPRVAKHRQKKKEACNADVTLQKQQSNALDTDTDTDKNIRAEKFSPDLFEAFWTNWPATDRRTQKAKCLAKWKLEKLNDKAEVIQQHVTALKRTEKWRNGFEPAPLTYLNGKHWEDGLPEVERQSAKEANDPVYQSLVEKFGSAKRRPDGRIYAGGRIFNSDGSGGLCL